MKKELFPRTRSKEMNWIKKLLANWTMLHSAVLLIGSVLIGSTVTIALTKPDIKETDAVCSVVFAVGFTGFLLFLLLTGNTGKQKNPKADQKDSADD